MKAVKILGMLLLTFGFTQCKSTKFDMNPPFAIESSSFNNWVGGLPGVSGTRVEIYLTKKVDVDFDSLFFKNRVTKLEIREKNGKTFLTAHYDTSKKEDMVLDSNTKEEYANQLPKALSSELKVNEAVLSFKEGKKMKYVKIENIKQTASDHYPKMQQQ